MPGDVHHPPIQPERAIVVPRARRAPGGASLPLQALIEPIIEKCPAGVVQIVGPALSGKTTALSHLRTVLVPDHPIGFFDEPQFDHWMNASKEVVAIIATSKRAPIRSLAEFTLAEWSFDDCMSYLAAAHRDHCGSVLARLKEQTVDVLEGCPALLRLALDEMAADESMDLRHAFRRALSHIAVNSAARRRIAELAMRQTKHDGWPITPNELPLDTPPTLVSLLRHPVMIRSFAADDIIDELSRLDNPVPFVSEIPQSMIDDVAALACEHPAAVAVLQNVFLHPQRKADSKAATLLLAIDPNWRPFVGRPLHLDDAVLRNARWARIDLQDSLLHRSDLTGADLNAAVLNRIRAMVTNFSGTQLIDARMDQCDAGEAKFIHARLERLRAESANFLGSNFTGAKLDRAHLPAADFGLANLTNASFVRANLQRANLKATIAGTDFTGANLTDAIFTHADLRNVCFDHARLFRANLMDCNLEYLTIGHADFEEADLGHALLTGSTMREGKLRGANLSYSGLADIEWEGADLRDADLRNSSFHLGSTRSGLVGSTIPCEGSRTGFYTDEYNEQDYKPPEEIRKANLCGADLRGAKVEGVDFYLVDLRGAKYSADQAEHFRRCGAILRSRVA
jgi:uncharacterized protein YjbI with pentapeptide repeats